MYDTPSVKSTTIASNDPQVRRLGCRCNHVVPHAPLIGLDGKGKFKTTPAACYPPDLCATIADLFVKQWVSVAAHGGRVSIDVPGVPWMQHLFPAELMSRLSQKANSQSYPQQ